MNLAILGAGSWGTALAIVLAPRFERVRLWVYEPDLAARMAASSQNDLFLPGLRLPDSVEIVTALADAVAGARFVVGAMPSRHARWVYGETLRVLDPSMIMVSATKGLERQTLLRMSEVITEVVGERF